LSRGCALTNHNSLAGKWEVREARVLSSSVGCVGWVIAVIFSLALNPLCSSQVKSYSPPGEHEGSAHCKPQGPAQWGRVVSMHSARSKECYRFAVAVPRVQAYHLLRGALPDSSLECVFFFFKAALSDPRGEMAAGTGITSSPKCTGEPRAAIAKGAFCPLPITHSSHSAWAMPELLTTRALCVHCVLGLW
jgi:hypothetical protein